MKRGPSHRRWQMTGENRFAWNAPLEPARSVGTVFFFLDEEWRVMGPRKRKRGWFGSLPGCRLDQRLSCENVCWGYVSAKPARGGTPLPQKRRVERKGKSTQPVASSRCQSPQGQAIRFSAPMGPWCRWWRGAWKPWSSERLTWTTRGTPRLTDMPGCERACVRETPRRGLERGEPVAAVTDGAE